MIGQAVSSTRARRGLNGSARQAWRQPGQIILDEIARLWQDPNKTQTHVKSDGDNETPAPGERISSPDRIRTRVSGLKGRDRYRSLTTINSNDRQQVFGPATATA